MNLFIKLTNQSGTKVWVNASSIEMFGPAWGVNSHLTFIKMLGVSDTEIFYIQEPAADIAACIREASQ